MGITGVSAPTAEHVFQAFLFHLYSVNERRRGIRLPLLGSSAIFGCSVQLTLNTKL